MGFRPSYNQGEYLSSSSNLLPLAPPFSVDKSNLDLNLGPYMDFTQPPYAPKVPPFISNREPTCPPDFGHEIFQSPFEGLGSTPFSKGHSWYSSLQGIDSPSTHLNYSATTSTDTPLYSPFSDRTIPFGSKPYYHSYGSPASPNSIPSVPYDPPGWASHLFSTSDGSSRVEYAKSEPTTQYLRKKDVADLSGVNNLMHQGSHDSKASNSNEDNLFSIDMQGLGKQDVPSGFMETHSDAPLLVYGNCQLAYGASDEKQCRQYDTQSPVGTGSSTLMKGLLKDLNDIADTIHSGNNPDNVNEPHPLPSSERKVSFNPTQLSLHLERNDPTLLTNNTDLSNRTVSNSLDHMFKAKSGRRRPHRSPDALSLAFNTNEVLDSVEKSVESVDLYNSVVDPPCWNGAPASRFSKFEAFGAPYPQNMKKSEEYFGLNLQEPQNFLFSTDNTMNFTENSASEESKSDAAIKAKSFHSNPSCVYGVPHPDGISETEKKFVLPDKSNSDCYVVPLKTGQQSLERDEMVPEKMHFSGSDSTDVGSTVNDPMENGTAHATVHAISTLPSVEDVYGKHRKMSGEESFPKIDVKMLVKTMHNLSELLLFHRMNDTCELKEQDHHVLKDVINNLDKCVVNNVDDKIVARESFLCPHPDSSRFVGELHELHQNVSFDRPDLTKLAPALVQEQIEDQTIQEAIKRVLSENFYDEEATVSQILLYKDLWLEAEAELCSVNYRARFDHMKNEMEKCLSTIGDALGNIVDGEKLSKLEVFPDLTTVGRSATKANDVLSPDSSVLDSSILNTSINENDVMARYHILSSRINNSVDVDELSSSRVHPGLHEVNTAPEAEGSQTIHNVIQDSPVSGTKNKEEDFEVSVMARFHVLKSRIENSSCVCSEGQLLDVVGFAGSETDYPILRKGTDDESLDVVMDTTEVKPNLMEFHLNVEEDQGTQSRETSSFSYQHPTNHCDSLALDWEHVLKEDLVGQNN
ncbi:Peroxidase [Quillaja saponaria]|uniref:Peroxidase n=1 Tax=Quillaja saponaria TaxID=32244 RepID=A0AAD7LVW3_QUISA|nr:Peroxidase [Quillaja saponaria]